MLKCKNQHIGDSWYYIENDICHCYFLTCQDSIERHTAWNIAHATSKDLKHWEYQGIVLEKGSKDSWDGETLATGSVVKFKEKYWMAYTGNWNSEETAIGMAVSEDLYSWNKISDRPVLNLPASDFASNGRGLRKFRHWRDAKMYVKDDNVYALICTTSKESAEDACGAVAVMKTKDMYTWETVGELPVERIAQEYECPQVYKIHGKYYLIFSCFKDLFSEQMQKQYGDRLRQTSYYMVADSAEGPYRFERDFELIPRSTDPAADLQYANQIVKMNSEYYIMGTVWSDNGDYIADPLKVRVCDRQLITNF